MAGQPVLQGLNGRARSSCFFLRLIFLFLKDNSVASPTKRNPGPRVTPNDPHEAKVTPQQCTEH